MELVGLQVCQPDAHEPGGIIDSPVIGRGIHAPMRI